MRLNAQDYQRIAEAIAAAEQRTAAEIICVLARRSSDYHYVAPLWAGFAALVSPWPLLAFTALPAKAVFLAQIAVFVAAVALISWPPLRLLLIPRRVKRARAHRAAMEQFFGRGVAATSNRAGVLIYVSLAERYARIVADEGVPVAEAEWQGALDLLRRHMRAGEIAEGFVAAVEDCARLLAPHVPPGGRDELPNKVFVIDRA